MAGPFACLSYGDSDLNSRSDRRNRGVRVTVTITKQSPIEVTAVKILNLEIVTDQTKSVRGFENDNGSCWPQMRYDTCLYG